MYKYLSAHKDKSLFFVFICAFLARLISLNQSLWLDEGTTARVVIEYDIFNIVNQFTKFDFHPPLYYLFMDVWSSLVGYSETLLRLPSVLFSLYAGWFVFLIGKKIKDETTGLWAAAFFLFNPLILYYSQEMRMYMMVICTLAASLYFYIKILKSKKINLRDLIVFNLCIFLSFFTFYGSVFLIVTLYIYLLFQKKYELLFKMLPGFILSVIVLSPLLYIQYDHSKQALHLVANWRQVLGTITFKNLALIPLKFSIGRISFDPKALYYTVSGLWTTVVFIFLYKGSVKNKILIFMLVGPLLLGFIFSVFSPLLQYFRFVYLIVPVSLLLAVGATKQWQKIILFTGFIIFSSAYLFIPQFHREDWKSLAIELGAIPKVYAVPSSMDALRYYRRDFKIQDIRNSNFQENIVLIIPYTLDIYGYDYKGILTGKKYKKISEKTYRGGVSYEVWRK